jgi:hypothetical protein
MHDHPAYNHGAGKQDELYATSVSSTHTPAELLSWALFKDQIH